MTALLNQSVIELRSGERVAFGRLSGNHDLLIQQYADEEDIAPVGGITDAQKLQAAFERCTDPNFIVHCLIRHDKLAATLTTRLTDSICGSLDSILTGELPPANTPNTAMHISIRSDVDGAGRLFLNRAVADIKSMPEGIKTFCTLSPADGFPTFLEKFLAEPDKDYPIRLPHAVLAQEIRSAMHNRDDWWALLSKPEFEYDITRLCEFHLLTLEPAADGKYVSNSEAAGFHGSGGAILIKATSRASKTQRGWDRCLDFSANWLYPDDTNLLKAARDSFRRGRPGRSEEIQRNVHPYLHPPYYGALIHH